MATSIAGLGRRRGLVAADGAGPAGAGPGAAARLRALRLDALGAFAPLLAGAGVLSALVVAATLLGHLPAALLASWLATVAAAAWLTARRIGRNARDWRDRDVPPRIATENGAMLALLAAVWIAAPAFAYPRLDGDLKAVIAGTACALMCGALAIVTAPIAATAWAGTLTLGIGLALFGDGDPYRVALALSVALHLGFIVAVVRRVDGLAVRGDARAAERNGASAAAARLLRDYEERGTACLWRSDAADALGYVSPGLAALIGRPAAALVGATLPATLGGHAPLAAALAARACFADVEAEIGAGDACRTVLFSGTPVVDAEGGFLGFQGACEDVTVARRSERRLRRLAQADVLTGLPNRQRMRELVADELRGTRERGRRCALMMLDLDGFKPVNDSLGHLAGDALLVAVAARLVAEVGEAGTVGRVGGDEFAVLLPGADPARTAALAVRLIEAAAAPYAIGAATVAVGLSIGTAAAPGDGDGVDALIRRADLALYEAKAAGRGTWRRFDPAMEAVAENRLRIEQDLRRALPLGQFRLAYQPIVRADDRRVETFEAFLRWHHPTRGVVPPAEFIPIAEECGLMDEIGDWVLRTAAADCARLPAPIAVAVNLSPCQLRSADLPARVADALGRARLSANRLELEVDERVFAGDAARALDVLRRLRALGVCVALDDFGTGRASLGALNRAAFSRLKIDGSFVRDAGAREEACAIVRATVALAACLGMTVTAEGVETAEEFRRMAALGCHRVQGFLLGRPLPIEHAAMLVAGTARTLPLAAVG